MTKDEWIQRAKALLFDCAFALDSEQLKQEARTLINQGGGFDPDSESASTPLQWDDDMPELTDEQLAKFRPMTPEERARFKTGKVRGPKK